MNNLSTSKIYFTPLSLSLFIFSSLLFLAGFIPFSPIFCGYIYIYIYVLYRSLALISRTEGGVVAALYESRSREIDNTYHMDESRNSGSNTSYGGGGVGGGSGGGGGKGKGKGMRYNKYSKFGNNSNGVGGYGGGGGGYQGHSSYDSRGGQTISESGGVGGRAGSGLLTHEALCSISYAMKKLKLSAREVPLFSPSLSFSPLFVIVFMSIFFGSI